MHRPLRFDYNLASFYLRGSYDDARIFDSSGNEYEVDRIHLYRARWWWWLLSRADNLFILPRRTAEPMVEVDMSLDRVGSPSLSAFCARMQSILLDHPTWWNPDLTPAEIKEEIATMFEGCETFADAINAIGVWDSPQEPELSRRSEKVIDHRPSIRVVD